MSKVLPIHEQNFCDQDISEDICPRYEKWIKRITKNEQRGRAGKSRAHGQSFRRFFSTRRHSKRRQVRSENSCNEPLVTRKTVEHSTAKICKSNKDKPLRSRSLFVKIRQKGRNFGIRCKTSVELWRKWIKRGIKWDRHSNAKDSNFDKSKSDQKFKFAKKSIITDVIPEEDEPDDIEKSTRASSKEEERRPKSNISHRNSSKTPVTIKMDNSFDVIVEASSVSAKIEQQNGKTNSEIRDLSKQIANHQATQDLAESGRKYSMKQLEAINTDHIEKLEPSEELNQENLSGSMQAKSRRAIHRAFNKLMLLF